MMFFNRKKKKQQKTITDMAEVFKSFERLEHVGMLCIDMKAGRVFISSTLAVAFIGNEKEWAGFLSNTHCWFEYRVSQDLWDRYFKDVEIKAVREAKKKYAMLTEAQIREIRFNARSAVNVSEVPSPEIRPFDFVVATGMVFNEQSEVILVGSYARGHFDMQPFNNVASSILSGSK